MNKEQRNNIITCLNRAVNLGSKRIYVNPAVGVALTEISEFSSAPRSAEATDAFEFTAARILEQMDGHAIGTIGGISVYVKQDMDWDDLRVLSDDITVADLSKEFNMFADDLI